jgi:hypothetical protein
VEGEDENFRTLLNIADTYIELHRNRLATYMYRCINHYVADSKTGEAAREKLSQLDSTPEFNKKTGVVQNFDDGEVIFCENEPPNEVYILKKGKVRISRIVENKDIQLFIMKPGDVFGEMALLEKLNFVLENNFKRVSYTEAIDILRECTPNKKKKFNYIINEWGADLQSEHERYLVEKEFNCPVILTVCGKYLNIFHTYLHLFVKIMQLLQ